LTYQVFKNFNLQPFFLKGKNSEFKWIIALLTTTELYDVKGHMLKVKERVVLGNALCMCQFSNCDVYWMP
jgi:hypothetical protein